MKENTKKKKILITGCAGLVGSACVELFSEKGWDVVGVDNNGRSMFFGTPQKDFVGVQLNICDEQKVNQLFIDHSFDVIIHAAAQPSHDYSKDHVKEDFLVNAWGTLVLLEATRHYRPDATFIFVSTDKVYGEKMVSQSLFEGKARYDTKMSEGFIENLGIDFVGQRSPFGCSKTAADIYVQEYGNYFGMNTACFRLGCITGSNHEGAELHGFLAYLAKCIRLGKPYRIFGNGKNVRDQIHAKDLANAFWHFAQNPKKAAVYNMGGGIERSVSILEAIDLIEKETGKKTTIEYAEPRQGDRLWDIHDVSKFHKDYPEWDYSYSLQEIIKDVCSKKL